MTDDNTGSERLRRAEVDVLGAITVEEAGPLGWGFGIASKVDEVRSTRDEDGVALVSGAD